MERLIEYLIPENYQLELRVNKQTEEVQGHVVIKGQAVKPNLKLHARELKIAKITITTSQSVLPRSGKSITST